MNTKHFSFIATVTAIVFAIVPVAAPITAQAAQAPTTTVSMTVVAAHTASMTKTVVSHHDANGTH